VSMDRRTFLKNILVVGAGAPVLLADALRKIEAEKVVTDPWKDVTPQELKPLGVRAHSFGVIGIAMRDTPAGGLCPVHMNGGLIRYQQVYLDAIPGQVLWFGDATEHLKPCNRLTGEFDA
jgi:hypothetical protein